ncbi:MAG: NAD(P)/FAD-dependent oxidoreductase [Neomegalonema sp.]|nr:NAD(P)/FAD-dependent oxidoreductase [Neomegalonema sp.]
MQHDVIIIGGGYAGMAAALQLVRARRSVLVIDAGQRRNRFADSSHGFLGQDGVNPAEIADTARAQLAKYPTMTWRSAEAQTAEGEKDAFDVRTTDGDAHLGRRILFATGLSDTLPPIDGLGERWGKSAFHCPYCHGYELNEGRIGVIASGPMSLHQALIVSEWGATTLLLNSALTLDEEAKAALARRDISVAHTNIAAVTGNADVRLVDGQTLSFAGLFVAPHSEPATPIAQTLGCKLDETPMGRQIYTDLSKETSVAGAFACGDVARVPHSLSLAVADGAWAGAQAHQSLVF